MLTIDHVHDARINGPVITLKGLADFQGLPQLNAALDRALAPKPRAAILDLGQLEFIGSGAIGAMVEFRRQMRAHGGRVIVAAASQYVADCFRLSRLDAAFERCSSVSDALAKAEG